MGAAYNPTAQITLAAGVSHSRMERSSWNIYNAVAAYNFSKRTDVFLSVVHEKAAGPDQRAALFLTGPSTTNQQTVVRVGIRHFF